jgi:hypothetical protein
VKTRSGEGTVQVGVTTMMPAAASVIPSSLSIRASVLLDRDTLSCSPMDYSNDRTGMICC